MTKSASSRRLKVPVRFVDGIWECALGGQVPVKEGSQAELVVERHAIADKSFLEMLERKARHKVLDEGTKLLVALTVKAEAPPPKEFASALRPFRDYQGAIATQYLETWNPGTLAFVEVSLAGPDDKQARLFDTDQGGLRVGC